MYFHYFLIMKFSGLLVMWWIHRLQLHQSKALKNPIMHNVNIVHDDVIKWKRFLRYWPFARGIHRSAVNSPHKGQRCGALMFSLICARTKGWANNRDTDDLICHCVHYDFTVMYSVKGNIAKIDGIIIRCSWYPINAHHTFIISYTYG